MNTSCIFTLLWVLCVHWCLGVNTDCGKRSGDSQPNGTVDITQWPWQVAILKNGSYICSGSIISDRWILTAAHCITVYGWSVTQYYLDASDLQIQAGSATLHDPDAVYVKVSSIINLGFDYDSSFFKSDVALLNLRRSLHFTDKIRPVCLSGSSNYSQYTECYTTGWGSTTSLQEATMTVLPDDVCKDDSGLNRPIKGQCNKFDHKPSICYEWCHDDCTYYEISDDYHCDIYCHGLGCGWSNWHNCHLFTLGKMLCAQYENGSFMACNERCGGPLVCRDDRNVWTQIGVASWGSGCLSLAWLIPPVHGKIVFTKLSTFYSNIVNNMTPPPTPVPGQCTSCGSDCSKKNWTQINYERLTSDWNVKLVGDTYNQDATNALKKSGTKVFLDDRTPLVLTFKSYICVRLVRFDVSCAASAEVRLMDVSSGKEVVQASGPIAGGPGWTTITQPIGPCCVNRIKIRVWPSNDPNCKPQALAAIRHVGVEYCADGCTPAP